VNVDAVVRNEQSGSLYLLGDESVLAVSVLGVVQEITPVELGQLMASYPATMKVCWISNVGPVPSASSPGATD